VYFKGIFRLFIEYIEMHTRVGFLKFFVCFLYFFYLYITLYLFK